MRIVAHTDIVRARVTQELRVVLPPCGQKVQFDPANGTQFTGERKNWLRRVQLLVPGEPKIFWDLDKKPELIGVNRGDYKLPALSSATLIRVHLLPDQWIIAASEIGTGQLGLIVEYYAMEG